MLLCWALHRSSKEGGRNEMRERVKELSKNTGVTKAVQKVVGSGKLGY